MNRRTLTQAMLAGAIGTAIPGALSAQTPDASPATSSAIRPVDVPGVPLALSPDGSMLAGFGDNDTIRIWDAQTLEIVAETEPFPEVSQMDERSITWSPDSSAIAWSLHAAMYLIDSDIFMFNLASGMTTNVTEDEPKDKPAIGLMGNDAERYVLNVDVYPAWSADGEHLVFARSVAHEGFPSGTTICRVAHDGGDAEVLGPVSPGLPLAVSSIWAGAEDGSVLYTTWPPTPDDPIHGVFLMSPNGVPEGIFTGELARPTQNPVLMDIAPAARKASMVSQVNYGTLDNTPGPIWFELDLDTGVPTPFEEIFSLPTEPSAIYAVDGVILLSAPTYLTDADGAVTGYLYATSDAGFSEYTLWRHDTLSGGAESLGTFQRGEGSPRRAGQFSRIETGANGTTAIFHGGQAWVTTVDG